MTTLIRALATTFPIALAGTALGQYDVQIIDPIGSSLFASSSVTDVSNEGRAVGINVVNGVVSPFEWTAATGVQPLATPLTGTGRINDLGDMLYPHTVVLADGSQIVPPYVDGSVGFPSLRDMNDARIVVGSAPGSGTTSSIFIWDPSLGSRSIDIFAAKGLVRVSESGFAVGNAGTTEASSHAFRVDVWTNEVFPLDSVLPPGVWSEAADVNEHGAVTGRTATATASVAFAWSEVDGVRYLPGLDGGLAMHVHPRAIDDAGQVVGQALTPNGWDAFLWNPQTGMHNLNALVTLPPGFDLQEATDISETGVIVGRGYYGTSWGPNRGVILAPTSPWRYLGQFKAGANGAPLLSGSGPLTPGSSGTIRLDDAPAGALALAVISVSSLPTPFQGGTLVPFPPQVVLPLATASDGTRTVPFTVPTGLSGADVYFQFAVADPTATQGTALSNALRADFP
ncbi:MAG: hypothetical protein ACF8XB_18370 [Planctomycetota bacterium JB042]